MRRIRTFLLLAAASLSAGSTQAGPVTLTCSSSVNLYAQPYMVVRDSKAMTVHVIKTSGPLAGRRSYRITQAGSAAEGGYLVTASGRLHSQILVMVSPEEKWVEYMDVFTHLPFATDYCN
jgi:hypothetical protein